MRFRIAIFVAAMAIFAVSVDAHHSFSSTYRDGEKMTIEGEVVHVVFRNPHSFIHLVVKEERGAKLEYDLEWEGSGQLAHAGVTRETVKPGDHLIVTGIPARNPQDHWLRMMSLRRPKDGFGWTQSSSSMN